MSVRISDEDLEMIHRKAAQAKLSFTEYVTRCCLGKKIVTIDGLDEVIRHQKAIGRNLNQLTMLCNMGRISEVNLSALTGQHAEMNRCLARLLERQR